MKLPQVNVYAKYFDENNKWMNLIVKDEEILEKYNKRWSKIKSFFKREFGNEPVYNDKYINTKIKIYNNVYIFSK